MAFDHPFYFLRHGETDWNKIGKAQGHLDIELNATGIAQAQRASELLADEPIERIISSPLIRARRTAEAVAKHHHLEIQFDDGLKECHLGDMQGQLRGTWFAEYWSGEFEPPNGETFGEFSERVWNAMKRAVAMGPNTLIVAHGGLWVAAHQFTKIEPALMPMPNAVPLHISPANGVWHHTSVELRPDARVKKN